MQPVAEGFKELGLPALRRCADSGEEWAVIDEIGYLETACPDYCAEILTLMEKKKLAAAVRKQELPFLTKLCRRPDVFLVDLDNPFGEVGCVIMASGLGRRFGGNKLLAKFGEKPLIQWALDATEGIFARRVAVTRHREVEQLCRSQGIDVILHDLPDRSDTIRLGLDALCEGRPPLSGCLFCPADQPLLHRETVASLALLAAGQPDCIWRPSWQEQAGAPVLFPRSLFEELRSLPQGRGGNWIIRRRPELVRLLSVRNPWELEDVDRPQDMERLAAFLSCGPS